MFEWKPIETAPKDEKTPILGASIVNGVTMLRTTIWAKTPISKYNQDGGFWICPNKRCVIGPFTHWTEHPTLIEEYE